MVHFRICSIQRNFFGESIKVETKKSGCQNHGDSSLRFSLKPSPYPTWHIPSNSPWHRVIILSTRIHRRHCWQPNGNPPLTGGPPVFCSARRATTIYDTVAEETSKASKSRKNLLTGGQKDDRNVKSLVKNM